MSKLIASTEAKHALLEKYLSKTRSHSLPTNTIPRRATQDVAPLSYGQQQMWLLSQLIPDAPVYNETVQVNLPVFLDVAAFERSFHEIIQRHEAWRTNFVLVDGEPVQVIHPTLTLPLPLLDLLHLPEEEREREALRIATEKALTPFDLAQGPLLRPTLIRLDEEIYRLYLSLHHIVFDGMAIFQVFLPELHALYTAFSQNQPSPLPPLPIQYADFATWQRNRMQKEELERQLAYWKQRLQNAPTNLEFPTDFTRSQNPTYQGSTYSFPLSQQLSEELKALSAREGVTLFMILVAAFQTLLYRYTGQDDLLLGTSMASREYPELQGLLGYFQNTVVLRNRLSGSLSFRELLRQVRDVVLEAHAHQDIPFEYLVKELQPDRLLGQNPLFRTMIVVEPTLSSPLSGWTLTSLNVQKGTAKFDLFLNLEEQPDGLISWFEYSTELFEATTIARIAQHLQTLLESIVADPQQSLSELPLLTEVERRQMLVEWNATDKDYGRAQCVHTLFEEQVERTPDAVAVVFEGESLTYRELDARANQLAHHLQQQGVQPDTLVGVCMERSFEMVISLFAILKAGGAYVPLDPGYPLERLVFMLQDASMPLVLTQERFKTLLASQRVQTLCVDSDWHVIAKQPSELPQRDVQPHHLAYMIYTSGSTGRPKGAMNEHRGICNRLLWMQDAYGLQEGEAVMQKTPFSFDVSVWEFFWPLIVGARLVVARPEGHRDSSYLVQLIQEQHITTLHFVPSMLRFFLEERNVEACRSLKRVICSGEALPYDLQQSFFEWLNAELHNLYGPTEAAVDVSAWACERDSVRKIVPIGKPIANLELYVLDAHLQPVPIGVTGELYIGGVGVGRGYLNRPELTRERFIPDPFKHKQEGGRLYKTGDVVRYLPDGNIEYLGRADQQVKLRGQRIELGEIEAILDLHPAIREAVVVVQKENTGDMRLVAYISFHKEQEASPTTNDLYNYMKAQIPAYMIPSAFVVLPTLPLLPNGKVNRQALPKADVSSSMKEQEYVIPVSLTEHQLVQIWEELLNVYPIGIRNNFFSLGGNSLLAVRLVSKIEQSFGRKLPSAVLFAQPTIEQLAAVLQAEEKHAPVIGVSTTGTKPPFFYLPGTWNTGAAYCFSIARNLGPDQPFYVVEPPYFDDFSVSPTVKMTAKAHIESIRTVQPEGPYQLGGFCNGALVAYEMARQLRSMGEEVKLLVLIDPAYPPVEHTLMYNLLRSIGGRLGVSQIRQLDWFLRLRHMYKYIRHERNEKDLEEFTSVSSDIHSLFPSRDALRKDNIAIFNWLIADYNYTTFEKATLVRAAKEPLGRVWRKLAKKQRIEAHIIAGDHISCRTDHVDALAEELKNCL